MKDRDIGKTKSRKEVKAERGALKPHLPKSKKEEQEFGKGKIDVVMCPDCEAVYYYKSWHHALEKYQNLSENKRVKFSMCPACKMIKNKMFEGQIIIRNIAKAKKQELLNLIDNIGEREFKRDPMDRIIKIKNSPDELEILTTENQLAVNISKQVKRAFKGKMEIKWSQGESVARVILILK